MVKQRIDTGGKVFGPYSPGVKANGIIWLAGQIAPEAGGIREQTQASLDKIDALLAAAGVTKHEVTFAQVLLNDISDFTDMNEIYGAWLDGVEIPRHELLLRPPHCLVELQSRLSSRHTMTSAVRNYAWFTIHR